MSEVGDDGPITIRDLMRKGVEVLEKNYGDDPRFVIGMLINISGRYMNLGDTNGEYAALVKAEQIARKLGDPEFIARVQCNTVETELAAGRPNQARERMRDGLDNLAKVVDPALDRVTECGAAQARLLWSEGKLPEAITAAQKIAELLESKDATDDLLYGTLATMLAVMLREEGRYQEARDWNQRLILSLEKSGNATGLSLINARHHQASDLYVAGEMRAALDLQRPIVEQVVTQEGMDNVPAGYTSLLGLYQVTVEETDAGLAWLDRAVEHASVSEPSAQIGALMNRARAYITLHRYDRAVADIDAAEQLAQSNPAENRAAARALRLMRAEVLHAHGEFVPALALLDEMLQEIGYPNTRIARRLAAMLALKARVQVALGENVAALDSARDAVRIAESDAPEPKRSANVAAALLALAEAQRANGDPAAARATAERAAAAFSLGLGPDHSLTKAALTFR
jgi:tetratricopeptide (TPR) repeat protein